VSETDNDPDEHFRLRTELFANYVTREGATLLPGCFGGEGGQDRLAYLQRGEHVILLLGLKLMHGEEGIQLDTNSLGSHLQLSPPWIEALVTHLRNSSATEAIAAAIAHASSIGQLTTAVMLLDLETQKLRLLPVNAAA